MGMLRMPRGLKAALEALRAGSGLQSGEVRYTTDEGRAYLSTAADAMKLLVGVDGYGTAGQVLTSTGPGSDPTFQAAGNVGDILQSSAALSFPWLPCDGRKVSQSGTAALFAVTGHQNSPVRFPWVPSKISDPAVVPTGNGTNKVGWSPNGRYLVFTTADNPASVFVYDCISGSPVKIADPPGVPSIPVHSIVGWSRDSRYLTLAAASPTRMITYDWDTGSPVAVADPATAPTGGVAGVSWSPNGRYQAVAHSTSPFVSIYDWATGVPVKIADPATLPTGNATDVCWSPSGRYLVVAHSTSPFVTIYDWATGAPVKITNPATLPTGNGSGCDWSADGKYLAVGHSTTPFITIYDWSTGTPVKIANPATLPGLTWASPIRWSPNGLYLAGGIQNNPGTMVYDFTSGVAIPIASFPANGSPSAGSVTSLSWSPNSRHLACAFALGSSKLAIYDGADRPASLFYLPKIAQVGSLKSYIKAA